MFLNGDVCFDRGIQFQGGVVGKALKGTMCTYQLSGVIAADHSPTVKFHSFQLLK